MASIASAQVDLLKTKFLSSLGGDRSDFAVANDLLSQYAKLFIDEAINNLNEKNSIDRGRIADDLTFSIQHAKGKGYVISIGYSKNKPAAKYYDFINKGVSGVGKTTASPYRFKTLTPSRSHVAAMRLWIQNNKSKVTATDVRKYSPTKQESKGVKMDELDSNAYNAAKAVKRKGIDATYFFDDAITQVFNGDFRNMIAKALAADVSIQLHQDKFK